MRSHLLSLTGSSDYPESQISIRVSVDTWEWIHLLLDKRKKSIKRIKTEDKPKCYSKRELKNSASELVRTVRFYRRHSGIPKVVPGDNKELNKQIQKEGFFFSKDKAMAEMSDSNLAKTTVIQQAIASCCGAIITSLFVTPLDVIKTRLQAQSNPFYKGKCFVYSNGLMDHICVCDNGDSKAWYKKPGHFKGMLDAFVKITQREGVKSLWSGLPPTLIMALPTTVIYFTCYDQLSEALKSRLGKDDEHIPILAGSLSRFGSVTIVSPLELIRTRMQFRKFSYKQLYLCISSKVASDGWLSLWRGWSSTVLRDVPFSAYTMTVFEDFQ
ncbi:solute carrier family 25 member 40 [Amazona aestiva]|uniref:Solute carrier family 25 member 40 n=1 Tax=Amazona aestiva TaxID=12930 RepID=A0A0Q3M2A1_AMAAE|nr:solute carrier family 25 member 40 [Amazona aestiva]